MLGDEEKEAMRQGANEAYDRFARKIGEKYPWLHPDYDPSETLWQMRASKAYRRMSRERKR